MLRVTPPHCLWTVWHRWEELSLIHNRYKVSAAGCKSWLLVSLVLLSMLFLSLFAHARLQRARPLSAGFISFPIFPIFSITLTRAAGDTAVETPGVLIIHACLSTDARDASTRQVTDSQAQDQLNQTQTASSEIIKVYKLRNYVTKASTVISLSPEPTRQDPSCTQDPQRRKAKQLPAPHKTS